MRAVSGLQANKTYNYLIQLPDTSPENPLLQVCLSLQCSADPGSSGGQGRLCYGGWLGRRAGQEVAAASTRPLSSIQERALTPLQGGDDVCGCFHPHVRHHRKVTRTTVVVEAAGMLCWGSVGISQRYWKV